MIHPVSLLRSWTPVEPMCPCLGGHIGAAPTSGTVKASDDEHFGAHSRSFGTCSPTLRVSCCHSRARLASGWLAGLYREGVEPSGSLRKVSDHLVIPLSCPPDATHVPYDSLIELRAAYTPDTARSVSGRPSSLSRRKGHPTILTSPNLFRRFRGSSLALASLDHACLDHLPSFPRRSRPWLFTTAARGGLGSAT